MSNRILLSGILANLGKTSEEVAMNLTEKGIKGKRRDCRSCPVAKYLCQLGYTDVSVVSYNAFVASDVPRERDEVELPFPIRLFISQFDMGQWSILLEPS